MHLTQEQLPIMLRTITQSDITAETWLLVELNFSHTQTAAEQDLKGTDSTGRADKLKEYASRREMGSEMKETKGGHMSRDRTKGKRMWEEKQHCPEKDSPHPPRERERKTRVSPLTCWFPETSHFKAEALCMHMVSPHDLTRRRLFFALHPKQSFYNSGSQPGVTLPSREHQETLLPVLTKGYC